MSEKRTESIRFAVRPSEKATYEGAAAQEGLAISEWMRRAADAALLRPGDRDTIETLRALLLRAFAEVERLRER